MCFASLTVEQDQGQEFALLLFVLSITKTNEPMIEFPTLNNTGPAQFAYCT